MTLSKLLFAVYASALSLSSYAQTYTISAQNTFGGNENDDANDLVKTADNGIIMVGSTNSKNSFDVGNSKAFRGNGGSDFWVIKVNPDGKLAWSKTFGGSRDDEATSIARTANGEYVIIGPTKSIDGDANFNGTNGGILMIRLKEDGSFVSSRVIPGGRTFNQDTYHYSNAFSKPVVKISTAGNIYIGGTYEIGNSPYKAKQLYLTKLTPSGDTLWEKIYGSDLDDQLGDFAFASNGDIQMVGSTTALKSQIAGAGNGNLDFLAIRVTNDGTLLWQKAWGGDNIDAIHGLIENHQKTGFVLVGETSSNQGIVSSSFGHKDAFVFEIDTNGNLLWKTQFGGEGNDNLYGIVKVGKSNYMVFGTSDSKIQNVPSKGPLTDVLTLTLNKSGTIDNIGLYGGEDIDVAKCGIALNDSSWVLAGVSRSSSEDLIKNYGENDFWLLKLSTPPPMEIVNFRGFKNLQNQGEISWKTNYEIGAKSIQLEKSNDNKAFIPIKNFTISENSSIQKLYTFIDPVLNFGSNYYRLRFTDNSGKTFLGPSMTIDNLPLSVPESNLKPDLFTPYPNPAVERIQVAFQDSKALISLFDITGALVSVNPSYIPNVGWEINLHTLKAGSYILQMVSENKTWSKRFVKI